MILYFGGGACTTPFFFFSFFLEDSTHKFEYVFYRKYVIEIQSVYDYPGVRTT